MMQYLQVCTRESANTNCYGDSCAAKTFTFDSETVIAIASPGTGGFDGSTWGNAFTMEAAQHVKGTCDNSCPSANDGRCDDGRAGAFSGTCLTGTDCNDCGVSSSYPLSLNDAVERDLNSHFGTLCSEECFSANDGVCDDGGRGGTGVCATGTDCADCGTRVIGGASTMEVAPTLIRKDGVRCQVTPPVCKDLLGKRSGGQWKDPTGKTCADFELSTETDPDYCTTRSNELRFWKEGSSDEACCVCGGGTVPGNIPIPVLSNVGPVTSKAVGPVLDRQVGLSWCLDVVIDKKNGCDSRVAGQHEGANCPIESGGVGYCTYGTNPLSERTKEGDCAHCNDGGYYNGDDTNTRNCYVSEYVDVDADNCVSCGSLVWPTLPASSNLLSPDGTEITSIATCDIISVSISTVENCQQR